MRYIIEDKTTIESKLAQMATEKLTIKQNRQLVLDKTSWVRDNLKSSWQYGQKHIVIDLHHDLELLNLSLLPLKWYMPRQTALLKLTDKRMAQNCRSWFFSS